MSNAFNWVFSTIATCVSHFTNNITILSMGLIPFLVAIVITGILIGRLF